MSLFNQSTTRLKCLGDDDDALELSTSIPTRPNTPLFSLSLSIYSCLFITIRIFSHKIIDRPCCFYDAKARAMKAYRLPSSGNCSPRSSPPSSPRSRSRSPRYRHRAPTKSVKTDPKSLAQRLAWYLLSVLLQRQGLVLFAPLLYISTMLFYIGTVSFDSSVPALEHAHAPGSVYKSPKLYAKVRSDMDSDNSSGDAVSTAILKFLLLIFWLVYVASLLSW